MSANDHTDERDGRVIEALHSRSPRLAGIYKTAVTTLCAAPEPGCENARISVICHCMRELMTGLPSVLSDEMIPRPDPSSDALASRLPDLLSKHPEADLSLEQDIVPVPKPIARALSDLVSTLNRERGRNRRNAASLVTGERDSRHPVIDQWLDTYRFFLGWTHLDRNHEEGRPLPSNEELLEKMRVVEDVIDVRTRLFFDNVTALQDLLAEINTIEDEV